MKDLRPRVRRALETIVENRKAKALNYAVGYAKVGIALTIDGNDHELKVQLLYVLSNITHWRGETAKAVRGVLKEAVKELSTKS